MVTAHAISHDEDKDSSEVILIDETGNIRGKIMKSDQWSLVVREIQTPHAPREPADPTTTPKPKESTLSEVSEAMSKNSLGESSTNIDTEKLLEERTDTEIKTDIDSDLGEDEKSSKDGSWCLDRADGTNRRLNESELGTDSEYGDGTTGDWETSEEEEGSEQVNRKSK